MSDKSKYDIIIIGAGPAGLSASVSAKDKKADVCIIEREERPGGILKQCIHDGFGVIQFKEKLTGPEYANRYIKMVYERGIPIYLNTFLTEIQSIDDGYRLTLINSEKGIFNLETKALILAMGCRERTARQIFIHGDRPSGVFTAGLAQYFINIQGFMPTKRCVILGSGDIGLIMARRMTLEGADVEGVYEIQTEPSGLTRNVSQCLNDYKIPLHLSSTVTEIHGKNRVEGVTVCNVDRNYQPIRETARNIDCDALILSVGLIPENEIAEPLDILIDERTRGPVVDQNMMTMREGVFSCGNALHVNDLVDYVSESADIAGSMASEYLNNRGIKRKLVPIKPGSNIIYVVPQYIDKNSDNDPVIYFRSSKTVENPRLRIYTDDKELMTKKFIIVKPPEMERVNLSLREIPNDAKQIFVELMED
jgi:thioredoxin reductase